ncbi:hypothetical protein EJ06DRAFT_547950 [Trichodelitschia bisporula]|uniref:chitin synthase n=1 Tax=Trichodelitschia bisporula TaxID=703511 RepID=A0A6G1I015_9PEZI|nr:hypothetical protein EJ06DRAFT_547950 [Trichodelitschia bisporula]
MWNITERAIGPGGEPAITDPWPKKDIIYVSIMGFLMLMAFIEWFMWLGAFLFCLLQTFIKAENMSTRFLALVTHNIGRQKRIKHVLDEASAPKVVIVMPCYKEKTEILLRTVDSIVDCEYPPSCLHVFLSFDGDDEDELYLNTVQALGVPLTVNGYPKSIDVVYRRTRITVSRFPHGGKRSCQKKTFKLIDRVYQEYLKRNDNLFILFIDSDCILDKVCIQNFMYEMELKPGSKHNMLAMTGVITSTTEKNSLLTILQDMEYIHGQLFERTVESGCGAVTCLPGALTILRFSAFRKMSKYYFADKAEQCNDLFDYGKCHLGEDRWLTHLFMIAAKERYQIQMNTGAFCKTEAVQDFGALLKQRRRWFLGFITNEACMLTDARLWYRYPILCTLRLAQNTIRTTALLFFIMVISLITTSQRVSQLPVGFIAVSLGLNWLLMFYFGAKLGRYKIWLYPIMFVVNPAFNWLYMVYGICTAGKRTWGGPRADASKASEKISPQEAIEEAEKAGDDLNVEPESFKPAAEIRRRKSGRRKGPDMAHLQPPANVEGRFAPSERTSDGMYGLGNDSGLTLPAPGDFARHPYGSHIPLHPRASFDSFATRTSYDNSIYLPRRVESFLSPEDQATYHSHQEEQRPAGGAAFERDHGIQIYNRDGKNRSATVSGPPGGSAAHRNQDSHDNQAPALFGFREGPDAPSYLQTPHPPTNFSHPHPSHSQPHSQPYPLPHPNSHPILHIQPPLRDAHRDAAIESSPPFLSPTLQASGPGAQPYLHMPPAAPSRSTARSPLSRRSFAHSSEDFRAPPPPPPTLPTAQGSQGPAPIELRSRLLAVQAPEPTAQSPYFGAGDTWEREEGEAERGRPHADRKPRKLTRDKWTK